MNPRHVLLPRVLHGAARGALLLWGVSACGAHDNDSIPPALLAAIAEREAEANYPAGPYGSEVGDTAQNVCIAAWQNPKRSNYAVAELEALCFSDFWDPDATDHRLLLVNTSALWCAACRVEFGGTAQRPSLQQHVAERAERGLVVLGALFQDAEFLPATPEHASLWAQTFEVEFAFGLDAPFAMGAFADPMLQPFNMLIDTQTMQIVLRVQGDEPATLWPAVDAWLSE